MFRSKSIHSWLRLFIVKHHNAFETPVPYCYYFSEVDCTVILAAEGQHRNKIHRKRTVFRKMRGDTPTCVTRGSRSLSTVSVRISRLFGSHFNRIGEVAVLMVSATKQTTGKHEKSDSTILHMRNSQSCCQLAAYCKGNEDYNKQ